MALKVKVKADQASVITGITSVTNAANLGGVGLFAQKNSTVLEFKGLVAGSNITLTPSATGVTIASTGGGASGDFVSASTFNTYTGTTAPATYLSISNFNTYSGATQSTINSKLATSAFNTYSGATLSLINGKVATSLFNTYTGDTQTALNSKLNTSVFNTYTGNTATELGLTITGASSLGGEAIYKQKVGKNFEFKGLLAGANITLTPSATGITIASTGGGGGGDFVSASTFNTYTGTTAPATYLSISNFNTYSGVTATAINAKVATSVFNTYTGDTATALGLKLDTSVFSTYTGVTQSAINAKVATSLFNTYTGDTATALGLKLDTSVFSTYTGITASAINAKVATSLFNSYTGDTATALGLKLDTSVFSTYTGVTASAINAKVATSLFNTYTGDTEPVITGAITGVTNLGTGEALFTSVSARKAQLKSLVAGTNITLTPSSTGVTIASTGGGSSGLPLDASITGITTTATLDASAKGKIIECTGTFTLTLPDGMDTGMQVTVVNISTGIITMAATTTLSTKSSYKKIASQWSSAVFYHRGSNVWVGFGDLTP